MNSTLTSAEIRERFLKFFEKRGHKIIPSASLVPDLRDPSVLFTTAGMQPLVPYLLGQEHPQGKRLVNIQKCVRTNDIDEVGDNTHLTFFEMMGNWSLGDYWKKESINWSYELLTNGDDKGEGDKGFGLDPQRLYVTCFEGDEYASRDDESAEIWREIFMKNNVAGERIYFRPKEKNWWSAGPNGPCGPDTEMFYDLTGEFKNGMTLDEYLKADDEQKVVEIWNNVFMEFLAKDGKVVGKLETKNVDTGAGFERLVAVVQRKRSVFDTDLFSDFISKLSEHIDLRKKRILADHIRASVFMIADGVEPSNKDRGYILRRLLRRSISIFEYEQIKLGIDWMINKYSQEYKELHLDKVSTVVDSEWMRFNSSLEYGRKEMWELKKEDMTPEIAFKFYTTYGLPFDAIKDEFPDINKNDFDQYFKKHQEISRMGAEQKFKGGLSGTGEMETKYHTSAHLLHQALRDVLDPTILCKGSNITPERLRFDFPYPRKLTTEEIKKLEDVVNEKISQKLPVNKVVMKKEEALKTGALHVFDQRYPDEVNVYYIGDSLENAYSKEFCGGPHTENTRVLGHFKIVKEEATSSGVRRIKAVLE